MNKYVFSLAVLILFATAGWSQNRAVLLHESFDGNTIPAGWSVQGEGANNVALHQLCEDYAGQFAFVKYPTFGDRYNTPESDTRFYYYNVLGVPQAFLDGLDQGTPTGYNVYVNNVLVVEAISEQEYEFEFLPERNVFLEGQEPKPRIDHETDDSIRQTNNFIAII